MDEIIANMSDEDNTAFFNQLGSSLTREVGESRRVRHELASKLPKTKANEKLRQLLLK
jgi:hypothetical protein